MSVSSGTDEEIRYLSTTFTTDSILAIGLTPPVGLFRATSLHVSNAERAAGGTSLFRICSTTREKLGTISTVGNAWPRIF
jgi:hypothetical protein